ncbi:uncharacterized protein LOC141855289 [Brevipalpus obovatus]|uniref:uncharacterized protein LOC141855289 n=1 Tax=Brevipalpus obovatus TaxID=246614 RepID=UPI003D9FA80C
MISRRKILSRSRDDINYGEGWYTNLNESDTWTSKEKLFKDHIQEVLEKWDKIDDEIWAKIIVMEKHKRVAKAYARASIITINGSDTGFDGYRIGINGLGEGPADSKVERVKKLIGQGIKLKLDGVGNILIKRLSRNAVHIKNWSISTRDDNSVSSDIIKVNGKIDQNKAYKLFDLRKFQHNIERELRNSAYPDRKKLEMQCISVFSFVKDMPGILDLPCYILIVNIVAMDVLKSRLPIGIDSRLLKLENGGSGGGIDDRTDRSIGEEIHIHVRSEKGSSTSSDSKSSSRYSPSRSRGLLKLDLSECRPRGDKHFPIELPSPDYDEDEYDNKKLKAKSHIKSSHEVISRPNNSSLNSIWRKVNGCGTTSLTEKVI